MPYNVIQGIWEHLRGVEDTFEAIYHYFGLFRPNAIPLYVRSKYPKNAQNHDFRPKIMIFSKWVYVLVWPIYGRKYAFGMSQTHFKRFYDIWGTSGAFFKNPKKNRFFDPFFAIYSYIYIYTYIMVPAINRPYGFGRMFRYLEALSGSNGYRQVGGVAAVQYHDQKITKMRKSSILQSMIYKGKNSPVEYSTQNILKV